jgi:GntR family transcriptional regulator/MocR family aminotransferase
VIYIGTFSKVLFPSLRIGYLVVPERIVDAICRARALVDRHSPTIEQAVLADFIVEGHFARHIRRMRALYATRQAVLVESLRSELGDLLEVTGSAAGMHLLARLPDHVDDVAVVHAAAKHGVEVQPLSAFHLGTSKDRGLVLGYAAYDERHIREAVRRLAVAFQTLPYPERKRGQAALPN